MPKLSIITVNLNNREGLQKTIASVLNQSYIDYEYLIIDGGSNDGSVEVIKENKARISFWVSEPDKGIYYAMNKGILQSKGEYLQFLNSGDVLFNSAVLSSIFNNELDNPDIITGDFIQVYPNGKTSKIEMPEIITTQYLYSSFLSHPSSFIRKELFIKHGMYDESYKIAADHAFFVKVFLTDTIKYIHRNVVVVNFEMDGISAKPVYSELMANERIRAFKEQLSTEYYRLILDYNKLHKFSEALFLVNKYLHIHEIRKIITRIKKSINITC